MAVGKAHVASECCKGAITMAKTKVEVSIGDPNFPGTEDAKKCKNRIRQWRPCGLAGGGCAPVHLEKEV